MRPIKTGLFATGFLAAGLAGLMPAFAAPPSSQPPHQVNGIPMLVPGEGRSVATRLATLQKERYTVPAIGQAYAARLQRNAAIGRYDALNWKQLCDRLTADLRAVHPDLHLFVNAGVPGAPVAAATAAEPIPATEAAQWAAPGIAYLRLNRFTGERSNEQAIRRFLVAHQQARTVILDLRDHRGGRFEEMDSIIPLLFARRTPLLDMSIAAAAEQESGPFARSASLETLSGSDAMIVRRHWAIPDRKSRGLQSARVLVLISKVTGSAGEHLADALKVSGRATLIGQRTAGANHFGGEVPISDHFYAFLPMGRTYDFRTGKDWEGSGVEPDVQVAPKDALTVALRSAGLSDARARATSARIESGLAIAGKR